MNKLMHNTVYFMLLLGSYCVVSFRSAIVVAGQKDNQSQHYALLSGGGMTKFDNHESFYKNIEYAYKTLKFLGYNDKNIKTLFYGGKTEDHPIVEGDATKKNFIFELKSFGRKMNSNDFLVIFRSGHGMLKLILDNSPDIERCKSIGTKAVMRFPDGDLSHLKLQGILKGINAKQIVVILNQCFAGKFTDIALHLENTIIITETGELEMAVKVKRKTINWSHDEWPFVKCIFDGFTKRERQSVYGAYHYQLKCNPHIRGVPVHPDRPFLKTNPKIKYGNKIDIGTAYLY